MPPVWPAGDGDPRMQLHLDVEVDDLATAVEVAVDAGARLAEFQPQDDVRVLLDVRPRIISITSHATVAPPSPKGDRWTLPPMGR